MKPWTIYIWTNKNNVEGATAVVTKDGVKDIYTAGWRIERDPEAQKNNKIHKRWRARNNVKKLLNNLLNVINWYGKKVLDDNGNIDTDKFDKLELKTAKKATKINYVKKYGKNILNKNGTVSVRKLKVAEEVKGKLKEEDCIDMSDINPIKAYPIKEITKDKAKKYKLI
jgi:hypothetical protein